MAKKQSTAADFEQLLLIVHMIAAKSKSTLQAAPFAHDRMALLETANDTINILYGKFEKLAVRVLGEKRRPDETPAAFFSRISSLSAEELLARMRGARCRF